MTLTSRQRLTRHFAGQDTDRVPIWLLAPYHRVPYYVDLYNLPAYRPVTQAIARHADTFDRRSPSLGFCFNANPDITRTPIAEDGKHGDVVRYGRLQFERSVTKRGGRTQTFFYVNEPEELEDILAIPYVPHVPQADILRKEKAELGEQGLFMLDLGDPLLPLYHLSSAQNFSLWTMTDLDALLRFTDVMAERSMAIYRRYLDLDIADAYFIVGAEFAGPPLVSPENFGMLSQRYLSGIIDLIRSYGKISIVHYHGNLYKVLPGFKAVNPDGLHTIEAPPIGDCTLTQARAALGRDMTLIGNIQYDDLERQEPAVIREMVREAMREGKSGRFILSPSAGPYDPNPTPRLIENYLAFIEAGVAFGQLG